MSYLRSRKRSQIYTYLVVFGCIVLCWSMPKATSIAIQKFFVSVHSRFLVLPKGRFDNREQDHTEILSLRERVAVLEEQVKAYEAIHHTPPLFSQLLSPYFQKLTIGRVIYRDPAYWGSSCWVNVGKNQGIRKNSPVLQGKFLIGLIDYVGENQSRIRLITDIGMSPSVVGVRGGVHAWLAKEQIRSLVTKIDALSNSYLQEKQTALSQLQELFFCIQVDEKNAFLSRGVLSGRGGPLWKPNALTLYGEGFSLVKGKTLRPGDILVTTGLDGVFPPGLLVAEVTKVELPPEGACAFKLEAQSFLCDESQVAFLILPPMEFNPNDRPDIFGLLWDE